jgi:hypothetical protein
MREENKPLVGSTKEHNLSEVNLTNLEENPPKTESKKEDTDSYIEIG